MYGKHCSSHESLNGHSLGSREANKAQGEAECFISLSATRLMLYFPYSTRGNALTLIKLSWNDHCSNIAANATRVLNLLHHTMYVWLHKRFKVQVFVLPILEYACMPGTKPSHSEAYQAVRIYPVLWREMGF